MRTGKSSSAESTFRVKGWAKNRCFATPRRGTGILRHGSQFRDTAQIGVLAPAERLRTLTVAIDAGDQYKNIAVHVAERSFDEPAL